ncbi:MAG: sigma-70 family RNA polymerase sigma factor [Anaerolineae bacterium]
MPEHLAPNEERALIRQVPQNPEAFRRLYQHYFPRLFAYAAYRVGGRQEAEDVTATVFMKVVEAIGRFEYRGEGSFATWLFSIAHREVQQFFRTLQRRDAATIPLEELPEIESGGLLPDEAFDRKERFAHLRQTLLTLSPRRQEIVTLRFFGGLRNQEIAIVLGLDERTVASHLCRGLEDLKHAYQREEVANEPQ